MALYSRFTYQTRDFPVRKLLISVNLPGYTDVHRCVIAKLDDRCVFVWVFPGTHQQLKLLK